MMVDNRRHELDKRYSTLESYIEGLRDALGILGRVFDSEDKYYRRAEARISDLLDRSYAELNSVYDQLIRDEFPTVAEVADALRSTGACGEDYDPTYGWDRGALLETGE